MNQPRTHHEETFSRLAVIDHYRGFAILLMVLADYLSRIERVPPWLKHAEGGVGLTVVDLIAPLFVFAMALGYRPSFQRRLVRDGRGKTVLHFVRRFLALIGIGALTPWGYAWGLFQTLGGAGLISLTVIGLPWLARLILGGAVLGGYQVLSDNVWMHQVSGNTSWCEMGGTLSWAAMLILGTVLADGYYNRPRGKRWFVLGSLASLGLGIGLTCWIEVSQYFVSASYVLISLGASGLVFAVFDLLADRLKMLLPLLTSWGKNPLILYLLHYWIWVYALVAPGNPSWHVQAPLWLIFLQAGGYVGLLSLVAWVMDRKGWIVSL